MEVNSYFAGVVGPFEQITSVLAGALADEFPLPLPGFAFGYAEVLANRSCAALE